MSSNSLQEVATEATAGWYHAMCQGLRLDPKSFQLAQGNGTPVGTDTGYLWQALDAVPPYSAVNVWGTSRELFSTGYGQVISSLQDPPDNAFRSDLGDQYNDWKAYFHTYTMNPGDTYDSVFRTWALRNGFSPQEADKLADEMDMDTPITGAQTQWRAAGNSSLKAYTVDYDMVQTRMRQASAAHVQYTSAQSSNSFSDTWANGNADVLFDIFAGGGDSSYEQTSQKSFSGAISITMDLAHFMVLEAEPLAEQSNDSYLSRFKPWYDGAVLATAYANQDNHDEIWNTSGDTSWDDAFGPKGFLRYATTGLALADGMKLTMTVKAEFDQHDVTNIKTSFASGIWPFFFAEGSSGSKQTLDTVDSSGFSVTVTSQEGSYLILGASVEDAATALGS